MAWGHFIYKALSICMLLEQSPVSLFYLVDLSHLIRFVSLGPQHFRAEANLFHALRRQAKKEAVLPTHVNTSRKMGKQHRASGARRRAIKRAWGARSFVDREEEKEVGMKRYLGSFHFHCC